MKMYTYSVSDPRAEHFVDIIVYIFLEILLICNSTICMQYSSTSLGLSTQHNEKFMHKKRQTSSEFELSEKPYGI